MRPLSLALVLISAYVVAACGAPKEEDQAKTDTSTDTDTDAADGGDDDEPAEYAWPNTEEKSFSGKGDKVLKVSLLKGPAAFKSEHKNGESNFVVKVSDKEGELVGLLANDIGAVKSQGVVAIPADGSYTFEISADGDWTLDSFVPEMIADFPAPLSGKGALISGVFERDADSPLTIATTHKGDSNFYVKALDARTGEWAGLLANVVGEEPDEKVFDVSESGHFFLEVSADNDAEWTLKVK